MSPTLRSTAQARFVAGEIDALAEGSEITYNVSPSSTAPTTRRGHWKKVLFCRYSRTRSLECALSARRFAIVAPLRAGRPGDAVSHGASA